jgi:hypothetical protein
VKKPGWPNISAINALAFSCQTANEPSRPHWVVIPSQNLRKRSTRFSGALPAMIAALIAPIEIPATQSGKYCDDANAS